MVKKLANIGEYKYTKSKDGKTKCPFYKKCPLKYSHENINAVYKHVSDHHEKQIIMRKQLNKHLCSCNKRYKLKKDLNDHQRKKEHPDAEYIAFNEDINDVDKWWELRNLIKSKNNGNLFNVIMCDPPTPDTAIDLPYNEMRMEKILSMPVEIL